MLLLYAILSNTKHTGIHKFWNILECVQCTVYTKCTKYTKCTVYTECTLYTQVYTKTHYYMTAAALQVKLQCRLQCTGIQ